ncbi:MAG: oligosaccharide flippase family protein, partial [Syntrophales bacterium LBB04]|nr:oligosaccharide flippase family protein [Syntrophales bacterium LBB04]
CYGKGDIAQAQSIRDIVFSQYMGPIFASVAILFIVTFILRHSYSSEIIFSLWLVCLLVLVQAFVDSFLENLLRTDNRFDVLSKSEIFKSFIGFFLMIIMIWFWHLYGLIISIILSTLIKGIYIRTKTSYRLSWVWDFKELKRLSGIGFPIIAGIILIALFESVDRLVIIRYLDSRQLGFYALALTLSKFLLIALTGVYGILEPRVYQRYGEQGEIVALQNITIEPMIIFALLYPLFMGLAYIGAPYFLHLLLPNYLPSLTCVHIMIVGSFFSIFFLGTYTFIVAINRQILIVEVMTVGILISIGINVFLIKTGRGIEGVALGTIGVNILVCIVFLGFTLNHLLKKMTEKLALVIELFLPYSLVVFFLVLADFLWPVSGLLKEELGVIALKGTILLILTSPFFWRGKNKIQAFGIRGR